MIEKIDVSSLNSSDIVTVAEKLNELIDVVQPAKEPAAPEGAAPAAPAADAPKA